MGGGLYGDGFSRVVGCRDEVFVAVAMLQGGANVVAFYAVWIEVSELGGGFIYKYFCTRYS